jgi:Uma2 family endonuclease
MNELAGSSIKGYTGFMTWAEVCEDPRLKDLPYRIETDRWGNIVMSPPPRSRHAEYQGRIVILLNELMDDGFTMPECPLDTSDGTKAIDVAWVSRQRRASKVNDPVYVIAPEICVEVMSASNSAEEMMCRRQLFFEKGAVEFWLCDTEGKLTFFDAAGSIPKSNLCSDFPSRIVL